jgi:hypothetical protein
MIKSYFVKNDIEEIKDKLLSISLTRKSIDYDDRRPYYFKLDEEKQDIIEKFIYDSVSFHLKNLNYKDEEIQELYIEFWFKKIVSNESGLNEFHVDCDNKDLIILDIQEKYNYPLLSCVTYLNDCNYPLLISRLNYDDYIYKDFNNKYNLNLIFPKKNKQIVFDGRNLHGVIDILNKNIIEERNILAINVWKEVPSVDNFTICKYYPTPIEKYVSMYDKLYTKETNIYEFEKENTIMQIESPISLDFNFYEDLLYRNKMDCVLSELVIEKYKSGVNDLEIYDKIVKKDDFVLKRKLEEEIHMLSNTIEIVKNRFIQRHIKKRIYCKTVCDWLLRECISNVGYNFESLELEQIKDLFNYVLMGFLEINNYIKMCYNLVDETLNIRNIQIINSKILKQQKLDKSINVLVALSGDIEILWNNNSRQLLEQGDLIVYYNGINDMEINDENMYLLQITLVIEI